MIPPRDALSGIIPAAFGRDYPPWVIEMGIRRRVKKWLGMAPPTLPDAGARLMARSTAGRFARFGTENPDKVFYVIWRYPGPGLFSIFSSTLCEIHLAESLGMVPVVDMENFTSHYNEDHPIDGTRNAWQYYFSPVSDFSLDEVYRSRHVVFCDGYYPPHYTQSITKMPELRDISDRYIRVKPAEVEFADQFTAEHFAGHKVLGVHFRGQEFRVAPGHSYPPTPRQMINRARTIVEKGGYDRLFVVTEEQSYLDLFKAEFRDRVINTDAFRTKGRNAYQMYARPDHRYLLGRDILRDVLVLARCDGLLCSDSNVSEIARFLNRDRYADFHKIANGQNSSNPLLARYLWFVKRTLPRSLGGFPHD